MKISIKNLKKEIGHKTIFSEININSNGPEIIGIVGRNGVGKTTLFKTVIGIYKPTDGEVYIDNDLVSEKDHTPDDVIYVPDKFDYFNNFTLAKVIKFYQDIYDDFDAEKFYDEKKRIQLNCNKETRIATLSKGELTILAVLLAKATNCPILFIDEPFDGIDIINIKKLTDLLIDEEKTIFISSHRLIELQKLCNRIFFIEEKAGILEIENEEEKFSKVQIVFSECIPPEIEDNKNAVIINSIGRVVNVIFNCRKEDTMTFLNGVADIVQYDFLNVTLEDIFIFKDKEKLYD